MFKLGGKTIDAQGTGITSGLDTQRNNYVGGGTIGGGMIHGNPIGNRTGFKEPTLSEQLSGIDVGVPESTRKRAFWSGIGQGFGSNPRTLGEALRGAVQGRDKILDPAEAAAGERRFELDKAGVLGEFERGTLIQLEELSGEHKQLVAEIASKSTKWHGQKESLDEQLAAQEIDQAEYNRQLNILNQGFNIEAAGFQLASRILSNPQSYVDVTNKKEVAKFVNGIQALIKSLSEELRKGQAKGGRIGYQFGATNQGVQPVQASLNVDETIKTPQGTVQEDVSVQEKTQSSIGIPYEQFRAKMPPEVDDEIVQLIYFNEDAFADFAQITSQADVYAFNNKWGVSLVLPMDTETT